MRGSTETLERIFSDLGELQSSKTLTYGCTLQCEATQKHCICVSEYCQGALQNQETAIVRGNAETMRNILLFLYENGISPLNLQEILLDLRGGGLLAMEG